MAKRSLSQQLDELIEGLIDSGRMTTPPGDARLVPLLELAQSLRGLPRQDFKARLKADLERRIRMASSTQAAPERTKVRPVPEGYHTVTPYLCVKGAASAIEFYTKALGATEVMRLPIPDGKLGHAEIRIGDSMVMLSDEFPEYGNLSPQSIGGSPVLIHLYVQDVDALASRVTAAGVPVKVEDQDYGDRSGGFEDPFGHHWHISTHKMNMTAEEFRRRADAGQLFGTAGVTETAPPANPVPEGFHTVTPYLTVADGAKALEFYTKAFGARENPAMRFSDPDGRIAHSEFAIGDSKLMLNGPSEE